MRAVKGRISWTCDRCGKSFQLHHGYLSRFVMDRSLLERMVDVEQHKCGGGK